MPEPLTDPELTPTDDNGAELPDTVGASAAPDAPAGSSVALAPPAPLTERAIYDGPAIDIASELRTSYLGYAMSTIVSRALPDVRDGLKPVQRRILYAMRELGLSPNSRHLKSAKVVGECMGNFHPHGDQALYGTMVRMAQPFSLRYPMVDGQGNFGSVDDDPAAAMRYCVTHNNLIVTGRGLIPAGALAKAENIAETVLSLDGKTNTASKWFDCGAFPTRTVRTRRGYEVTGTTNHPLLVCVPGEGKRTTLVWKTIADLKVGDYMVLDRSETLFPSEPVDLTPLHPQMPETASREARSFPPRLDETLAHRLGELTAVKANPFTGYHANDAFMNALGMRETADRVMPPAVLCSPQSVLAAFLRGLFVADAATQYAGDTLTRVTLTAHSRRLAEQVQTVLLRFGIVSTRTETASGLQRLTITGAGDLARLREKILSPVQTAKVAAETERYLFDPVAEIADAGTQNVYSIRVDSDCHSFVAGGFVNHNTEARLTAVAMEMMEDIEKDTVNFQPTYDNERREPTVMPGKFPYLLCNGGSGIAVGMATNMPPHNLREICDASAYLLDHPDASIEQLMTYVPGPDFPTAGLILGSKGIKAAYHTGRGQVTMQAKTTIEPMDGGKSVIVISELPYQVIKKKLEEQIGELVREKKIDGITAVRDYSDKSGMRLVVELRRDVMPQKILNFLLKHTPLRLNFGVMMISLTEGGMSPKTLSLKTILQEYLDHRRDVITRRTKFELARAKARAHILEGLQIAVNFLDEVISIIRGSNSTEQARVRLIERFSFSGLQAEAILNMQLRQLTSLEQDKIEGEFKDLLKEIARFEDILMDVRRVNAMIKDDLKYLKTKFGDDRKTKIIPAEAEEINLEDLIKEEEMLITITRDGYIKRLDYETFRSQKRGGRGVSAGKTREEDNFEHLFRASTHDYILFFTDRGRVYRLKAFEVPQTSRQAMGTAIINLINIQPDEKITATVPIRDFRTAEGYFLMVTQRGEIKRTAVSEYANLRTNGLVTFDLEGDDALKWVKHTPGDAEVVLSTVRGMAIRFPEDKVPTRGRAAGGVKGITLDGADDFVVSADVVIGDADAQELLVISELGLGKRTSLAEYRSQGRGGKGLITMKLTERTGKCLVVATVISKESEPNLRLLIVTENGVMIRMKAEEIKTTISRTTSGVKLINLQDGDRVKTAEVIDVSKASEEGVAEGE